ncbi:MAG: hypothetical protein BGN94_16005 [Rhizobiales bacterium 68-8]|nr:MAG: hypothetical protein BGN94_16005 [Rhizobiales bacterium 68-8]
MSMVFPLSFACCVALHLASHWDRIWAAFLPFRGHLVNAGGNLRKPVRLMLSRHSRGSRPALSALTEKAAEAIKRPMKTSIAIIGICIIG